MTDRLRADNSLTKSDLIESLSRNQKHLERKDVELAVKGLLEKMSQELAGGNRIEIRGFGSFSLHFRAARMGRNPKSGDAVPLRGKYVPHFKPGKELRERVNDNAQAENNAATEHTDQKSSSQNESND
ncbi:UNVERIFIED_CONTAM: hypothetical protein GTU68_026656 [Idotea baltica]|nr:hypothetical protein [Idotea baltica]